MFKENPWKHAYPQAWKNNDGIKIGNKIYHYFDFSIIYNEDYKIIEASIHINSGGLFSKGKIIPFLKGKSLKYGKEFFDNLTEDKIKLYFTFM